MKKLEKRLIAVIAVVLVTTLLASPLSAQQKRPVTPKAPVRAPAPPPPPPTFDSLLATDSYRIYCELRGVGQLIRSPGVSDLLDPLIKLGGPPKEFTSTLKWLNDHADALSGSRMLVASWPVRPKLPTVLIAIEFASAEDAQKFEPQLRRFVPTLFPTPTPAPSPSPNEARIDVERAETEAKQADANRPPPFLVKQAGTLVVLADKAFEFRDLAPRGSRLLTEDANFAIARNRFASEQFFLFVDVKSIEKEERDRNQKWEEEARQRAEAETAAAAIAKPEASPATDPDMETTLSTSLGEVPAPDAPDPNFIPPPADEPVTDPAVIAATAAATREQAELGAAFSSIYTGLFGGPSKWPEAVGAAIAFESDGYIVRALIVNSPESKANAIPIVPQLVSGPALVPAAANVLPADVDLFATLSLDYPQMYDGMVKAITTAEETARKYQKQPVTDPPPAPPFAIFEKKLGVKIKDELLPLFGNEAAVVLLKKKPPESPTSSDPKQKEPSESEVQMNVRALDPTPVFAVSVKDKEAVKRLIPKMIESFGLKGASLFAQTERRGDTEIVSYANVFAYAFIGDFLVVSPNAALTREVVDAYLNHQTLSSDTHFKNFTRWQPRQVLGQVYIAPALMDWYSPMGRSMSEGAGEKLGEFVSRLDPRIEPLTYALTNDGEGPLHELHLPKNLVLTMLAGAFFGAGQSPQATNEAIAKGTLRMIASAEVTYQATKGKFGSLDQLVAENLVSKDMLEKYGYKIDLTVTGKSFVATAVPTTYGESGKMSFFIDESSVLRGGDHGGGIATISDEPQN